MRITGIILRVFAFLWILPLCLGTLWVYRTFQPDTAFLQIKQFAVRTGFYLPFFYSHIMASSIILFVGFFQFSKGVYSNKKLHRMLGKIYVFGVLFFAAPGAYGMTFFIHRGTGVFISFILQNTLWLIFTLAAWLLIRKGNVNGHVLMMRRSYSLAFAAVTLRFYIWLLTAIGIGVNFENNYLIIAFLSWIPNLLLVEVIQYFTRRNRAAYKSYPQ